MNIGYKKKYLLILLSFVGINCSANKILRQQTIADNIKITMQEQNGLQEIDKNNPPTDGVWMTWENAYYLAKFQQQQRMQCNESILQSKKEIELCKVDLNSTQKMLNSNNSAIGNWLGVWGIPLGILIGGIIGASIPIAVGANK
ncbi:hypothetical protein [uncultured Flavobacterium sp.]|uniref:hypothetical protein n=1 Tax=uncultured Flavobacterium sp. TaxID=165435 RepID=UPI0025923495|nr:hypothetical protein [uncultured Flavobacterium sp.]